MCLNLKEKKITMCFEIYLLSSNSANEYGTHDAS